MGRLSDYINSGGKGSSGSNAVGDMVKVELNESLAERQRLAISKLLVAHPETKKRLVAAIRKEIKAARSRISKDVHSNLADDPRKAYRAVKHMVYKRLLGGNVSILASRRAGARYELVRHRKLDDNPNQRGGNRRKRSARTKQLDTYFGKDRGFILRFLNSGTEQRTTRFGNRGSIASRGMFERSAAWQMDTAAENIARAFEEIFPQVFNEELK